jgi:chlorite dismutase
LPQHFSFVAGDRGNWRITNMQAIRGDGLDDAASIDVVTGLDPAAPAATWTLRGFASNVRYATRPEVTMLRAVQAPLAREEARLAALIPIKKTAAWWDMAQDERRRMFEETSRHTAIGLEYLPAVARQLLHSRDLGEPFDFLTWFEFAPEHARAFDDLLRRLRATPEWNFVDRETEIRLTRA